MRAGIAAVAVTALIAGCGGGGGGGDSSTSAAAPTQTATQVVVEASDGSFNPAQIYKDVSPGVVTIDSVFEGSTSDVLGGGGSAGQGSGFVVDKEGDIVTNAHVVTSGGHLNGGGTPHEAKQIFVEFGDRNRVPAEIKGFDADADVALIKVDPDGLDLRASGALGSLELHGRRAGRRDRQPVRRGPVALDRRDLGDEPDGRGAHELRHRQRDPDRRLDQPGQLGRAPARREGRVDRDQRADRVQLRQQLRRRLRDSGDLGPVLARPVEGRRQGGVRVPRGDQRVALPPARRASRPRHRLWRSDHRRRQRQPRRRRGPEGLDRRGHLPAPAGEDRRRRRARRRRQAGAREQRPLAAGRGTQAGRHR